MARVRHPNVVTIHGADVIDDRIGLWMELVSGQTLEQVVGEGKRFTAAEAVALGIDLCNAVAAVHAAGLLHRDIKASNVMMADDGRAVLMDFGTGRELEDATASLAGTPLYLAPELFAGGKPTEASDVYSIGVLLYRLLTGSYPVQAADLGALRLAHERGERARLELDARTFPPGSHAPSIARSTPTPHRRSTVGALAAELAAVSRASRGARRRRRVDRGGSDPARVRRGLGDPRPAGRRDSAEHDRWAISDCRSARPGAAPPIAEPTIVVLPSTTSGSEPASELLRRWPRRRDHPRAGSGRGSRGAVALLLVPLPRPAARSDEVGETAGSEPRRHRVGDAVGRPVARQRPARRSRCTIAHCGPNVSTAGSSPRSTSSRSSTRSRAASSTSCGLPWAPVSGATTSTLRSTISISRRARWSTVVVAPSPRAAVVQSRTIIAAGPHVRSRLCWRWPTPTRFSR